MASTPMGGCIAAASCGRKRRWGRRAAAPEETARSERRRKQLGPRYGDGINQNDLFDNAPS